MKTPSARSFLKGTLAAAALSAVGYISAVASEKADDYKVIKPGFFVIKRTDWRLNSVEYAEYFSPKSQGFVEELKLSRPFAGEVTIESRGSFMGNYELADQITETANGQVLRYSRSMDFYSQKARFEAADSALREARKAYEDPAWKMFKGDLALMVDYNAKAAEDKMSRELMRLEVEMLHEQSQSTALLIEAYSRHKAKPAGEKAK